MVSPALGDQVVRGSLPVLLAAQAMQPVPERKTTMSKNLPARSCACGCGEQPKRGQFRQGHDAKLRSEYLKRIRDGEEKAIREFLDEWPSLAYP